MGGAVSSGRDNSELIDNLVSGNYIRSREVERVFRALDRGDYMTRETRDQAYKDLAWRLGPLHLSAPCIYSEVMEGLELSPGLSFLNVGSGTGYLSTLAGLILGSGGISHGVEVHQVVVDYAVRRLGQFIQNSPVLDEFDFCEPKYYCGNGLCIAPLQTPYDRVYCGAGCPEEYQNYFKQLIKVGGILVMPLQDNLVQMRRVGQTEWTSVNLLNVTFATLRIPDKDTELLHLEEQCPVRLQTLCRGVVRRALRGGVWRRHPELRAPPPSPPPAKRPRPRRIIIPIEDESDVEGLNALHDLDRGGGASEMNALLSLVLSMGPSRVAGALRFDAPDQSTDAEGEGEPAAETDREGSDSRAESDSRSPVWSRLGERGARGREARGGRGGRRAVRGMRLTFELRGADRRAHDDSDEPHSPTASGGSERATSPSVWSDAQARARSEPPGAGGAGGAGDAEGAAPGGAGEAGPAGAGEPHQSTEATDPPPEASGSKTFPEEPREPRRGGAGGAGGAALGSPRPGGSGPGGAGGEGGPDDVPAEVEIYVGKMGSGEASTSRDMDWEAESELVSESESEPELSLESEPELFRARASGAEADTEAEPRAGAKRHKLDSGIGETTPSAESSPASTGYEAGSSRRSPHDSDCDDARAGRRRRQKRAARRSSGSGSSGSSDSSRRRPKRRASDGADSRRVRLSVLMKRSVKELPLPYALKKYVNLGRCFEF